MAVASSENAIRSSNATRVFIYLFLLLFALFYLLPLGIMLINSLKPLEEITGGGMVALPQNWTIEPWLSAWSTRVPEAIFSGNRMTKGILADASSGMPLFWR